MSQQPQDLRPGLSQDMQSIMQKVRAIRCEETESLAVLLACDELGASERASLEAHIAACPACAEIVERETRLQQAIAALDQPADTLDRSGLLLAQCRSELSEALDDRRAKAGSFAAILSPLNWWEGLRNTLVYHPAMSMTALLVAGFVAGVAGQRFPTAPPPPRVVSIPTIATVDSAPDVTRLASRSIKPAPTDEQLRSAESAHVAWITPPDSQAPSVQVQLNSPTPMNIVGPPGDADVQRVLKFLLENGHRFDPDVRLDSLDALRRSAADPEVRSTLCDAARLDRNPAVRMKALEALRGFESDPMVRDTLLDALESDGNSSVRVKAIHLLLSALQSDGAAAAAEPQTADVLRDRLRNDPSPTVRSQSTAALRALGEPAQ